MCAPSVRHRTMNQRPVSIDSPRQKRRIFVVRGHDDTVAFEAAKVLGQCQRYTRATARIRGVGDHVLLQLGHEGDARILDAPDFFGILLRAGHQCRFTINLPSIDTVPRPRGAEMRQATPVFNPAQEQSSAIRQQGCAGIEHAVDGVRPILARQDRVARVTQKQWRIMIAFYVDKGAFGSSHGLSDLSDFCSECISRSAIKNDSVDSAP